MSNQITKQFNKIFASAAKNNRPLIAFGLSKPDSKILASLRKSKAYAEIILVGPKAIKNVKEFKLEISGYPEKKLAEMLFQQKVDGIVRGTIDDFKTFEYYQSLIGEKRARDMVELGLVEDFYGRQFFISPASNPLGWTVKDKIKESQGIVNFMKSEMKITPKIGFLTGIRPETYQRKKDIKQGVQGILNKTFEDADFLVDYFKKQGIEAKNYSIEIETALKEDCNFIVPPNGMVGNQIFRALALIGGGKILTASRANLPHPYEDNSRSETDFETHIKWLVVWINNRKLRDN